jgi:hypothetical protein
MVPASNRPEIRKFATVAKLTTNSDPVDVDPLFHLMERLEDLFGFVYAISCAQFSLSVSEARSVRSPLVIPGAPVQPDSVAVTLMLCDSLTVGDTGGVSVSFPARVVHVNVFPEAGDDVGVDVVEDEDFLDEDPHADNNTMTAINAPVETT